jgi:uncharacterized protein (DUF2336 family)
MKCNPTASFPKILPWLAREAGVAPIHAEALWRRAERFADGLARRGTPVWSKLAMDRLRTDLDARRGARTREAALGRLWLLPARLWLLTAEACERTALALAVAARNRRHPA